MEELVEGQDFYWEERGGVRYRVFTEFYFLKRRTSCCGNGCRHCIFEPKHKRGSVLIDKEILNKFDNKK